MVAALIMVGNIKFLVMRINNFTVNKISINLCIEGKCESFWLKENDYTLKVFFPKKENIQESVSVSMNALFDGEYIEYKDIGYFVPETIFANNIEDICFYQDNNKLLLNLCP